MSCPRTIGTIPSLSGRGNTFDADVQRVEPEVLQRLDQHCALDARAGVVELHFGLDVHAEIAVLRTGVPHNNYNDHNWKSQTKTREKARVGRQYKK